MKKKPCTVFPIGLVILSCLLTQAIFFSFQKYASAKEDLISAQTIIDLRQLINQKRTSCDVPCGLGPFSFTDSAEKLISGIVRSKHILELRKAVKELYQHYGRNAPFKDKRLSRRSIKRSHITELQTLTTNALSCGDTSCDAPESCDLCNDCCASIACDDNGICDSGAGENGANCPSDCCDSNTPCGTIRATTSGRNAEYCYSQKQPNVDFGGGTNQWGPYEWGLEPSCPYETGNEETGLFVICKKQRRCQGQVETCKSHGPTFASTWDEEDCFCGDDFCTQLAQEACNTCSRDCRECNPVCGDGNVDSGEQCDDGLNNFDSLPDRCRTNCMNPRCGDGVVDSGEECDDQNNENSDGCSHTCQIEEAPPKCGDGVVDSGEECDDRNNEDGDGCDSSCQREIAECGNGVVEGGEECDGSPGCGSDCCAPPERKESCGGNLTTCSDPTSLYRYDYYRSYRCTISHPINSECIPNHPDCFSCTPVDGVWSDWTEEVGLCSKECGGGQQTVTRTRTCTDPSCGGNKCDGPSQESFEQECNTQECPCTPVDGVWSDWTEEVGSCSAQCGGGQRTITRTRTCTYSDPVCKGTPCQGDDTETRQEDCNTQCCPTDGQWSNWSTWTNISECSQSCGGGTQSQQRTRTCTYDDPSCRGEPCQGNDIETQDIECNTQCCNKTCYRCSPDDFGAEKGIFCESDIFCPDGWEPAKALLEDCRCLNDVMCCHTEGCLWQEGLCLPPCIQ